MTLTPAERGEIRNPAEPLIGESVNRARGVLSTPRAASPAPPLHPTTFREDDDGTIHTVRPLVWGLDSWGDEDALWTED